MSLIEIILIGIGLSMDAAAVSMSNGMVYKQMSKSRELLMPITFGIFQGLMPLLGFFIGGIFAQIISKYAGIIIFLILGVIGGKMIKDGWSNETEASTQPVFTIKVLILQGIATSIDAFAVGVGFCAMQVEIFSAVSVIAITTFVVSFIALFLGKKFGDFLENKALIFGGVILVIIGIKSCWF